MSVAHKKFHQFRQKVGGVEAAYSAPGYNTQSFITSKLALPGISCTKV